MLVPLAIGVLAFAGGCGNSPRGETDVDRALDEGRDQVAHQLALAEVEKAPNAAAAHVALSRTALHTERTQVGVTEAERAIALAPKKPEGHFYRALHMQQLFRNVGAIESAREALRLAPKGVRYHVLLGELLFGGGMVGTADYVAAEGAFREALALDPANARARFGLAKALILAGKHEDGLPEIEAFLVNHPYQGEARYLRGLSRMRLRDLVGAEDDFRRATRLAPEMSAPYFNLARVLQMQQRGAEAAAYRDLYERVKELAKRVHNAAVPYRISGEPAAAMAYGQALAEIGRTDEAIAVLQSAVVDHPEHTALGVVLSETLLQAGHVDEAWRVIARTSEARLDDPRPHVTAALVAAERGDPALAEEHARVAYELVPTNPDHALVLGNALIASGKAEEAVAVLEQGRAAAPGDPRFGTLLGEALVRVGRTPEGVRVLNEALRQNPENPGALHFRAVARTDTEPRGAVQDLRDAIRVAPNRVESYRALAQVLQKIGRDFEAAEWERRADDLSQRKDRMQAARTTYLENRHDAEAAAALATELQSVGREFEADRVRANASAFGVEP